MKKGMKNFIPFKSILEEYRLLSNHFDSDFFRNLFVQVDGSSVAAQNFWIFRQNDFSSVYFDTLFFQGISYLKRSNRTKDFTAGTGFSFNGYSNTF